MTISDDTPERRAESFNPIRLAKLILDEHGGNKSAAARKIGIAQATLWNILDGKYKPRADTLAKLARAYGSTLDFVSGRDDRAHDDTFVSGARAIMRMIRRDLVRLEEALESGELAPKGTHD